MFSSVLHCLSSLSSFFLFPLYLSLCVSHILLFLFIPYHFLLLSFLFSTFPTIIHLREEKARRTPGTRSWLKYFLTKRDYIYEGLSLLFASSFHILEFRAPPFLSPPPLTHFPPPLAVPCSTLSRPSFRHRSPSSLLAQLQPPFTFPHASFLHFLMSSISLESLFQCI